MFEEKLQFLRILQISQLKLRISSFYQIIYGSKTACKIPY